MPTNDQLWNVYLAVFDLFAADVPEIMDATNLDEKPVRAALAALAAKHLVVADDVNGEAQGYARRGQFKHLVWQCWETYDSTDQDGARATFLAAFPA